MTSQDVPKTSDVSVGKEHVSTIAGTQVSRFVFPKNVDGIADHIKNHDGGIFLGAAIADIGTISSAEMAQSMRKLSASNINSSTVVLPEVSVDLYKPVVEFNLSSMVDRLAVGKDHDDMNIKDKIFGRKYKYLCVRKVVGYFVPMVSATHDRYECDVILKNKAFREANQEICKVIFDSTISCSFFMSMDFYVNFSEIDKLYLEVHCNQTVVNPGVQWGAMKLSITCLQSSFPQSLNIFPTQVQIYPPYSLLFPQDRDPRIFNARLVQDDLKPLSQMYLGNEISFVGETSDQVATKKKTRYAGTRFAGAAEVKKDSDSGGDVDSYTAERLMSRDKDIQKLKKAALEESRKKEKAAESPPKYAAERIGYNRLGEIQNVENSSVKGKGTLRFSSRKPAKATFDPDVGVAPILQNMTVMTEGMKKQLSSMNKDWVDHIPVVDKDGQVSYTHFQDPSGNPIELSSILPPSVTFQDSTLDEHGMPSITPLKSVTEVSSSEENESDVDDKSLLSLVSDDKGEGTSKVKRKPFKFVNNEPERDV